MKYDIPNCKIEEKECCSKQMPWTEAKRYCAAFGYRLCSIEELQNACAERTGCDYDYSWVWTMNRCKVPNGVPGGGTMGHIAMPGDMKKWTRRHGCKAAYQINGVGAEYWHSACVPKGGSCVGDCSTFNKQRPKDTQLLTRGDNYQENEQGMMNRGNPEPYRQAWPGYPPHWYAKAFHRFSYLSAMKELFAWKSKVFGTGNPKRHSDSDTAKSLGTTKDAHNPLLDSWGRVCLPDNGEGTMESEVVPAGVTGGAAVKRKGVFVRCCGDLGWDCLKCPAGLTTAQGNGRSIYECTNPNGDNAFGNFGEVL